MSNVFMMILVPVALGIFILELYFLRKKGYKVTLDQTVLNISLGFFDRLLGLYLTERSLVLVHEAINYAIIPSMPSNWWSFLLTFLAVDFIWYVFHVSSHRISLFWGIHLVHHQSDEYNLSVNFALSPLGFIIRSCMYSTLVLVGFPLEFVILSSYVNALYQYYLHTEFINRIPVLEHLFVMPDHHKVHHGSNEEYLDKNYGGVFIIWDRIFGTYAPKKTKVKYGLTTQLVHKDFVNIQLFFFKKLINNFKEFGWKKGAILLFQGPEHQTPDVPTVFTLKTSMSVKKLILGGTIFVISYYFLLTTDSLLFFTMVFFMNFLSITLVNGIEIRGKDKLSSSNNSWFSKFSR